MERPTLFLFHHSKFSRHFTLPAKDALRYRHQTHTPQIQHTSLWPALVHILECPYKWEKWFLLMRKVIDRSSGVWISFCEYGIENKMALYKLLFLSFLNEYLSRFPFISIPSFHQTRISFINLLHHIAFVVCSSLACGTANYYFNKYVSKSSDCVD